MTVTVYACPADAAEGNEFDGDATCGREFTSENGAVMHALNTDDDHHAVIESKPDGYGNLVSVSVDPNADGTPGPDPDGDDGTDGHDTSGSGDETDHDTPDAVTPEIPEADRDGTDDPEGATCPECGEPLGVTEAEAERIIREQGGASCSECGAALGVDG